MRVGIIGLGSIGKRHASNAVALGHELRLFDTQPQDYSTIPGAVVITNRLFDIADHSDAVMICTPAATHADVAAQLRLEGYAGPLFVEKPLALSVAECEVFRSWPSPVQCVGYNWRHNLESQAFWGVHRDATTLWLHCATDIRQWPGGSYAHPLWECSHEIDLALSWVGETTLTTASFMWDVGDAVMRGGAVTKAGAVLKFDNATPKIGIDLRWYEAQQKRLYVAEYAGEPSHYLDLCPEWIEKSYQLELAHFLTCVEKNVPTITPFKDGLCVVAIVEQAMKMAHGQPA